MVGRETAGLTGLSVPMKSSVSSCVSANGHNRPMRKYGPFLSMASHHHQIALLR